MVATTCGSLPQNLASSFSSFPGNCEIAVEMVKEHPTSQQTFILLLIDFCVQTAAVVSAHLDVFVVF